mgnify:CR=1 FL=1
MKILILAHFYPPEMGGAGARLHGLSRWMADQGHDVTVIAGFPNYPAGKFPDEYKGKLKAFETRDGVNVIRTWVYATPKRSSIRRILNYLSFTLASTLAGLVTRRKFDVVLASSPPLFLGLSGWIIGRLRRIPFVFDIRDIWPEVAVEAGEFAPDGTVTRLAERLAKFIYKRADFITPVTENKLKKLVVTGVPAEKMTVVTNGVDLDYVETAVTTDLRQELNLQDKFIILYAGLLGIAQGVDIAVRAADILRGQKNIHFVIVGEGVKRDELMQKIETLQLQNVTMLPRQPREKIPSFLRASNVSLVPLVSSNINDAVPSKLLEAWAYSRPVILSAGGEAADIVNNNQGGLVITPGDAEQLAESIRYLVENPQACDTFAINGHELVRNCYDRRILAKQMTQVLQRAVQEQ